MDENQSNGQYHVNKSATYTKGGEYLKKIEWNSWGLLIKVLYATEG